MKSATMGAADAPAKQGSRTETISVLVPITERPEPPVELYRHYVEVIRGLGRPFEFIFICEPWARSLAEPLLDLSEAGEPIRILHAGQTVGEATLLRMGFERCRGSLIVTLLSYYRVVPEALRDLVEAVEEGADMAVARRWPRKDSFINRVQTRVFHRFLGGLGQGKLHDVACGVRAARPEVLKNTPLYGDFARFLPLFALREGYAVVEVDAQQHPKDRETRIYSPGVYVRRLMDLLGLFFLIRFTEKPLRFFGLIGVFAGGLGALLLLVLGVQRIQGQPLADRPLLVLGALCVVAGIQAVALGLMGEIIVHLHASTRAPYRLRKAEDSAEAEGPYARSDPAGRKTPSESRP